MEFNSWEEYRKLPDEFNRGLREEVRQETGKKKLLQLLISFAAVTLLIFPLTVTGHAEYIDPEPMPEPYPPAGPVIDDPTIEEYEIVGKWENNGQYYEFFSDGNGYWSSNGLFVLLDWEELSDGNYSVTGEGVFVFGDKSMMYGDVNFMTQYHDGQLYLMEHGERNGFVPFEQSNFSFFLGEIMPLFETEFKDRLAGMWLHEGHTFLEEEGYYVCVSYIDFQEDNRAEVEVASTISDKHAEFNVTYRHDDLYPDTVIYVGEGAGMKFELDVTPTSHYSYETDMFRVYHLINEKGEMLVAEGMNQNFLQKW